MKINNAFKPKYVVSVLAFSIMNITSAYSEVLLEEIIVTAERREQSLQDTPVAVTAFSDDFITDTRLESTSDLVGYVPGLHLAQFTRVQGLPTLRGAQSGDDNPGLDQPVAVFVDDVYKGRVTDFDLNLFDVERIEVLRGPQGTLYGRNVVGGLIHVITKKPTKENRVVAELSVGNFDLINAKGVVSGALSEENNLYGSVAFSSNKRTGFTRNVFNGRKLDSVDKGSAKLQLRYAPDENFEALFQADFLRDTGFGQHRDYVGPVPTAPSIAGFSQDNDPNTVNTEKDGGIDRTSSGFSLALDYDLGSVHLKSISAFVTDEAILAETSAFGLPASIFFTSQDYDLDQFTQEFRVSGNAFEDRLDWVAGAYFLNSDHTRNRRFDGDFIEGTFLGDIQASSFGNTDPQFLLNMQTIETNSQSAFFQGTYSVSDSLRLTVGGRYTSDDKEGRLEHQGDSFVFLSDAGVFATDLPKATFSEFTPRFTLEYDVTDDVMVYATYSEGFKSGGFVDGDRASVEHYHVPKAPEGAENMEIGLRSIWFDNRLMANVTAYKVDYTDLNVSQMVSTGGQVNFLQISSSAEAEGIEIELKAALTEGLNAFINYTYFDGHYIGEALDGNEMVSPPGAYSAGISYDVELANDHQLAFRVDLQHKDEYFQDPANEQGIVNGIDGMVNGSMTWTLPSSWEVSLWGKNLGDERAVNYGNGAEAFILSMAAVESGALAFAYNYMPPRTFGLSLRYTVD